MSEYVIQGQTLTGIADAIREQLGTKAQYTPESMAAAIGSIQGGGGTELADSIIDASITEIRSNADKVRQYVFYSSIRLIKAYFSAATTVQTRAFQLSGNLQIVCFEKAVALQNECLSATGLTALVLLGGELSTINNANALSSTPIASGTGYIYVPDNLITQYQAATNWSVYSAQIKGLSELPTEVQEWLDQQGGAFA